MVSNADKILDNKLKMAFNNKEHEICKRHWQETVLALGEVAAGVAHEIRNPLACVKGFSQLLRNQFQPNETGWNYINNILRETEKIEKLIEEFLMLSNPTFPRKSWVSIPKIVDEVLPMLAEDLVNQSVTVRTEYADKLPYLRADINQLIVMLIQLGKIIIRDCSVKEIVTIRIIGDWQAGWVEISFESLETSQVLPLEDASREDRRMLGMAISTRIIEIHQGLFDINYSEKGFVKRIVVRLPVK